MSNKSIIDEVTGLESEIENVKTERSTASGRLESEKERMQEECGVSTLAEAKKKLKTLKNKKEKLRKEADKKLEEIKEEFEW